MHFNLASVLLLLNQNRKKPTERGSALTNKPQGRMIWSPSEPGTFTFSFNKGSHSAKKQAVSGVTVLKPDLKVKPEYVAREVRGPVSRDRIPLDP